MVEFGYNDLQTVQAGGSAILQNIRPCQMCPKRVLHDDMTANFILRGIPCRPCCGYSEYDIHYSANIAIPEGGTAGEIQLAFSINGETDQLSIAAATPAAAEQFWHVSGDRTIRVPAGMGFSVAVRNASVSADPGTTPAPAVDIRNLNVTITQAKGE